MKDVQLKARIRRLLDRYECLAEAGYEAAQAGDRRNAEKYWVRSERVNFRLLTLPREIVDQVREERYPKYI